MSKLTRNQKRLLATLAWFDQWQYPLSLTQIMHWGYKLESNRLEVAGDLVLLRKQGLVEREGDMWVLGPGRRGVGRALGPARGGEVPLSDVRAKRLEVGQRKYEYLRTFVRWFRLFPFVRMIAVGNRLAYFNSEENDDIDFLVVAQPGRIWLARLWLVGVSKLLRLRPGQGGRKDKFCWSFFVDENTLNMSGFLHPELKVDTYLLYWTAQLQPIYEMKRLYTKWRQENKWVHERLPDLTWSRRSELMVRSAPWVRAGQRLFELIVSLFIFGWLVEKLSKAFQLIIMPRELKRLRKEKTGVIIQDNVLKFHREDKRKEYYERWAEVFRRLVNSV